MKPFVEKLTPGENTSFVARTYRTPDFEVPWHQHVEFELILFTEGEGTSYVGNHIGNFATGDIFFLGSNLPHTFQKAQPEMVTSAVVVQFRDDFWGKELLLLPEAQAIARLMQDSARGLKINGTLKGQLQPMIQALESGEGFARIIGLWQCLHLMATLRQYEAVSTLDDAQFQQKQQERIDAIIQYTIERFREEIGLDQVAAQAGLTVPAFCHFFKRSTKKTYIDFLNEVRIGYACRLLSATSRSVQDICFDSGFNTFSNFHRQFTRIKACTPSAYRRSFNA
jgi:AraC-like DNA-binding protein/quercetin dioxygenase-like cupin family protein